MKVEGSSRPATSVTSSPAHAGPASPFNVGSKAQLFVDRILVREARGIVFTLHPAEKHPDNPLIRADRPWEGWRIVSYGTVLFDEDDRISKMWYLGGRLVGRLHTCGRCWGGATHAVCHQ
jgi:hypothetical protein